MHGAQKSETDSAGARLAAGRQALIQDRLLSPVRDQEGSAPSQEKPSFERAHSDLVDAYLRDRLQELAAEAPDAVPDAPGNKAPYAIVAVGGYGRRELCLHSDVDLLVVCEKNIPPQALDIAQPLFLTLWDQGYDLGHGFRTIRDCLDLAVTDFQVFASLLDVRFIAGDRKVWQALRQKLDTKIFPKKCKQFLHWLEEQQKIRGERFGQADAALEPQLKEGLGGLRDVHRLLWLARCLDPAKYAVPCQGLRLLQDFFHDPEALSEFEKDVAFLLAVRNQLHRVSGRKNEKLHLDLQPPIAEALGFDTHGPALGVEAFLARLHRAMASVKATSQGVWRGYALPLLRKGPEPEAWSVAPGVLSGEQGLDLTPEAVKALQEGRDPLVLLRLFAQCAVRDDDLSWQARTRVKAALEFADALVATPKAWEAFLEILGSGNAAKALGQMTEVGFLERFLPPFGAVRDLVQFDAFHTYPVGWHTIVTVKCLEDLPREAAGQGAVRLGHLARLWGGLKDKRPLLLAALFHDLGKGGGRHEEKGAHIARETLLAHGMPKELAETTAFLVRNHLLLMLTATRRDLGDESVVLECANKVGGLERLRMLYLLSYADARATGPKAWSDWTSRLLAELYDKTSNMIQEGRLVGPHAAHAILKTRDNVRGLLRKNQTLRFSGEDVERWLEQMPPHYLMRVRAKDIVRHLELLRELGRQVEEEALRLGEARAGRGLAVLDPKPPQTDGDFDIWELAVAAKSQPGLFASIAGVLSLHDLNIFSADAFVWSNGDVVAVFRVSAPPDPLYADDFWARVRGALKFAMTGKLSLDYRLDRKRNSMLTPCSQQPGAVSVNVDNESTDFYTIVEVLAWDRPGLLYEIAHTLQMLQIDVHMAKVATHKDQVADYFYVRDTDGQKIEDQAQLQELRQALLHHLSRPAG